VFEILYFLWACSLFSTTPQGRRAQQLKTRPECWIRGLHEASTQGTDGTSANLFRKDCIGMQRSPKAMLLRDCHLPPMESDGRRSRPVSRYCTDYRWNARDGNKGRLMRFVRSCLSWAWALFQVIPARSIHKLAVLGGIQVSC
jgi:hypothetical protein